MRAWCFSQNSILGGNIRGSLGVDSSVDLNDIINYGIYTIPTGSSWANISNKPSHNNLQAGVLFVKAGSASSWKTQIVYDQGGHSFYRNIYESNSSYNTPWVCFSTDIPDFYKDYGNLTAFTEAQNIVRFTIHEGESYTVYGDSLIVLDYNNGSDGGVLLNLWGRKMDIVSFIYADYSFSSNNMTITNIQSANIYGIAIRIM